VRKTCEKVVGGVSKVRKNRPRDEVATRVEISGRLGNPNVSIIEAIDTLMQNAFFKAIVPGFDAELRLSPRGP
jgi:hypothetical protein